MDLRSLRSTRPSLALLYVNLLFGSLMDVEIWPFLLFSLLPFGLILRWPFTVQHNLTDPKKNSGPLNHSLFSVLTR